MGEKPFDVVAMIKDPETRDAIRDMMNDSEFWNNRRSDGVVGCRLGDFRQRDPLACPRHREWHVADLVDAARSDRLLRDSDHRRVPRRGRDRGAVREMTCVATRETDPGRL